MTPINAAYGNVDSRRRFLFVICGISFALLSVYSFFPYIPREGDFFACWVGYTNDLWNHGLGDAIRHTDGQGKFPTLAILMLAAEKLTGLELYDALQVMRLFTGWISIFGLFLLLRRLKISSLWSAVFTCVVHLHPVFFGFTRLNAQDASKSGFFLLAVYFFIGFLESERRSRRAFLHISAYAICSGMLTMVRSIDLLPLLIFGGFWPIFSASRKASINSRTLITESKQPLFLLAIPISLLAGLLVYGKSIVGHWGFSDGEAPQVWLSFYYLKSLQAEWLAHVPKLQILEHAVLWPINNIVNKLALFAYDFVLLDDYIKIVGVYRFVKDIELPGPNIVVQLSTAVLGVGTFALVCWQISKDWLCKKIWTLFLYAGLAAWFSWTFLMNHYEPRYWSLVFICWVVGLCGPLLVHLSHKSVAIGRSWIYTAAGIFAVMNAAILFRLVLNAIPHNDRRLAVVAEWKLKAKETCAKNEEFIWNVPFFYLRWTALRHSIELGCPRIEVICQTGHDFLCKTPENPNHKTVVDFTAEELDPDGIFR